MFVNACVMDGGGGIPKKPSTSSTNMGSNISPTKPSSTYYNAMARDGGGDAATSPQSPMNEQQNSPKSESDLQKAANLATEKVAEEAIDQIIDWGEKQLDKAAGFGDLLVPDGTPPSEYFGAATKAVSAAQTVYDVFSGVVDNYNSGESWGEIGTDAVLDVGSALIPVGVQAGTTWAVTKIGAAVGTAVAPGVGTAIGTVVGLLAGVAYDIWGKPELDDLFE